MADGLTIILHE